VTRLLLATAATAASVLVAGCSGNLAARGAHARSTLRVQTTSPSPVDRVRLERATPPAKLGFPKAIVAMPDLATNPGGGLAWVRPGTSVPPRDIRSKVQLGAGVAVGLADRGSVFGFVYPALSRDEGRSWQIDGPQFYHAGADGPAATSRLLASGNGTLIAWGPQGISSR
jgi:hypothetical protein